MEPHLFQSFSMDNFVIYYLKAVKGHDYPLGMNYLYYKKLFLIMWKINNFGLWVSVSFIIKYVILSYNSYHTVEFDDFVQW